MLIPVYAIEAVQRLSDAVGTRCRLTRFERHDCFWGAKHLEIHRFFFFWWQCYVRDV